MIRALGSERSVIFCRYFVEYPPKNEDGGKLIKLCFFRFVVKDGERMQHRCVTRD